MGVADPIFELQPSNLVRSHIFLSRKNAENFVTKFQVILELAKISVSVRPYLETSLPKATPCAISGYPAFLPLIPRLP